MHQGLLFFQQGAKVGRLAVVALDPIPELLPTAGATGRLKAGEPISVPVVWVGLPVEADGDYTPEVPVAS